jgi:hypothetical protein
MRRFVPLLLILPLAAAVPALATPDAPPDELDHNRRVLDRCRADPDHYNRLLRDLRAFQALPAGRQERMRQFDRDLHDLDPATQNRLWEVLQRYTDWASRLPDADQKRMEAAADGKERLAIVRELRQKDWMERLPETDRVRVAMLPPDKQAAELADYRAQERKRRQEWQDWAAGAKAHPDAPRPPRPNRVGKLPPEAQNYVKDKLQPALSDDERKQLIDADGKWPLLPLTVLDLCEKHPYLPPLPGGAITKYEQLPDEAKAALGADRAKQLKNQEGKWPDYALGVAEALRREKMGNPPPLGASRPSEFPDEVKDAIAKLKDADRAKLHEAEGRWPDYPQTLVDLARRGNLPLPGMTRPPGPPAVWSAALNALPEVPFPVLGEFFRTELGPEGKAAVRAAGDDKIERNEILKQEYFKKHPDQLQRWQRQQRKGK